MSEAHDPRARDEADSERRPGAVGVLVGVLAGVLVFLLIVAGIMFLGGVEDEEPPPDVVGTPVTPTPTPEETPTPTPTPAPTPTPTPTPTPQEREPTDADAASFAAAFEPPGAEDVEFVSVDVTGDGWAEIVFASLATDTTRVDVARWTGLAYEVVFTDAGGPAEEIVRFTVRDVSGDGVREIVTVQAVGQDGESLSIWGYDGEEFVRHEADGGCWDGSHTYGIIGAEARDGEIVATCDDAPLPTVAWSSDVYVWDGSRWTYDRTETP